jgi:hypothetical protein
MGNLCSTFEKADSAYSYIAHRQSMTKIAANIMKPMQTRIYRKKYVNGSENSKRTGLDLFSYVIQSPIKLVRQSL